MRSLQILWFLEYAKIFLKNFPALIIIQNNVFVNSIFYVYLIFFTSLFGTFISRKNLILFLLFMEIIFLSSNLMFVVGSYYFDDIVGLSFTLFLLAVAANEVANIGLAFFIVYTRRQNYGNSFFLNFYDGNSKINIVGRYVKL